ncbi:hypothetical protein HPB48_020310 [Haemaphysalis longicornis]|uniref:Uncharacterized protein n=1 Tax=Haemaphysalis longicornis TaxID=44386 RepID=A0A9J6FC66_HAELO|nr:hypothetical protein HPB48_020310 [Haemaphysalis longicornis]
MSSEPLLLLTLLLTQAGRSHQSIFPAPIVKFQPVALPPWLHGGAYVHTQVLPPGHHYAHQRIVTHGAPLVRYVHPPPAILTAHRTVASPIIYGGWRAPVGVHARPAAIATHVAAPVFTALAFRQPVTTTRGYHAQGVAAHLKTYVPPLPTGHAIVSSYFNVPGSGRSGPPPGFPSLDGEALPSDFVARNLIPQVEQTTTVDHAKEYRDGAWAKPPAFTSFEPQPTSLFNRQDELSFNINTHRDLLTSPRPARHHQELSSTEEFPSWSTSPQGDDQPTRYSSRVTRGVGRRYAGRNRGSGDSGELRWPFEIDFAALKEKEAREKNAQLQKSTAEQQERADQS